MKKTVFIFVVAIWSAVSVSCKSRNFGSETLAEEKEDNKPSPLFSKNDILSEVTIIADWKSATKPTESGDIGNENFNATVRFPTLDGKGTEERKATLHFRGSGRLHRCTLPTTRIEFEKKTVNGTIFDEAREVNLTTHCLPRAKDREEAFPEEGQFALREWLAYRIFELLEIPHYQTRRANLVYKNLDGSLFSQGMGFFVEKPKKMGANYNASLVEDNESVLKNQIGPENNRSPKEIDRLLLAKGTMAAAAVGHTDWCFFRYGESLPCVHLNNTNVITTPSGKLPVFRDFDLSVFVNGLGAVYTLGEEGMGDEFLPGKSKETSRAAFRFNIHFNPGKELFTPEILKEAQKQILAKKDVIFNEVQNRGLKPKGLKLIQQQLTGFYEALKLQKF